MNDEPRRTLRELIARHGPGLCSDARRCEGLLRDLCGEHRREINILVGALRERVPLDLLAGRNSAPAGLLLARLARRLEDQLALTPDASLWAVDSWALALGIVSDVELGEMQSRRDEAARPRVEAAPTPAPRPVAEEEPQPGKQAAGSRTPPPPTPPPTRRTPTAPPATQTKAQGGPAAAAQRPTRTPAAHTPAARTPSPPRSANTGGLQTPAADPAPRGRGRRWRGCLVGCFLIVLLSALLFVGGPLVLNLLREEQRQRSLEPSPVETR